MNALESLTDRVKALPPDERLQLAAMLAGQGHYELAVAIAEHVIAELNARLKGVKQ